MNPQWIPSILEMASRASIPTIKLEMPFRLPLHPPLDLNFFYNPVFDLHPHELRADAAGPEYVLHKSFLPQKSAKVVMSI